MLRSSHCLPVDHMHFLIYVCGAPDEFSLDLVNMLCNFRKNGYELHGIIGNTIESGSSETGFTGMIDHFYFPTSEFSLHPINDKLEISLSGRAVKDRETQILSKIISSRND